MSYNQDQIIAIVAIVVGVITLLYVFITASTLAASKQTIIPLLVPFASGLLNVVIGSIQLSSISKSQQEQQPQYRYY